jgi:hypothetical protein
LHCTTLSQNAPCSTDLVFPAMSPVSARAKGHRLDAFAGVAFDCRSPLNVLARSGARIVAINRLKHGRARGRSGDGSLSDSFRSTSPTVTVGMRAWNAAQYENTSSSIKPGNTSLYRHMRLLEGGDMYCYLLAASRPGRSVLISASTNLYQILTALIHSSIPSCCTGRH